MSTVCESDAMASGTPLYRHIRRELSSLDEATIRVLLRELHDIGVEDIDDLKEVKRDDVDQFSLKKVQKRKLMKYIDKLNGTGNTSGTTSGATSSFSTSSNARGKSSNFAAIICARGSEQAKVRLVRSNISISASGGNADDDSTSNTAVFGRGNIDLIAEDTPITLDVGDKKKGKKEEREEDRRTF